MLTGNTPQMADRASLAAAHNRQRKERPGRPHPLDSCAISFRAGQGGNRRAMSDVLPHTHNSPLKHSGGAQIFPDQNILGG